MLFRISPSLLESAPKILPLDAQIIWNTIYFFFLQIKAQEFDLLVFWGSVLFIVCEDLGSCQCARDDHEPKCFLKFDDLSEAPATCYI